MRADKVSRALKALEPAVVPGKAARAAFEHQLRLANSQWAARQLLDRHQLDRLKSLVRFAAEHTPYYRERIARDRLAGAATLGEALARLPILPREALREHADQLRSGTLPKGHTIVAEKSSSGSTGVVVRAAVTNLSLKWQSALGLRSHLWGGRDFRRLIAIIRRMEPGKGTYPGIIAHRWGPVAAIPFPTSRAFQLSTSESVERQWQWLKERQPVYLLTVPSIVRRFAGLPAEEIAQLPSLSSISTIGEVVDSELRTLARERLQASIHDMYSCEEGGCLAIQCPDEDMYHVPDEAMILEILDEHGGPASAGKAGRVVITPLANYATPLIRYEIGDYAEAAGPCACGRTLTPLKRIMGRRRNLLMTPDGRHFWPGLSARRFERVVDIRAYQFRQVAPDRIEVWLAMTGSATPEQEREMREIIAKGLPAAFHLDFRYVEQFPPHPAGKHEEFVSFLETSSAPHLD
jgi:phenylacetate-CoA ligase